MTVALALVAAAAALDILANVLLASSDGFRRRLPGVAAIAMVGLAFFCLSLAVKTLPLSIAYACWGAMGILGTSLGGWLVFGQRPGPCAYLGMLLLMGGMVVLRLSA